MTVVVFFCLYLFLIAPRKSKTINKFTKVKYAHRGLHNSERAENSMSAFLAAAEAGYGIEMDVRLSRDGKLVVFHDDTLERVCGVKGRVSEYTAYELSKFSLNGTGEGIPLFSDVLAAIDGRVPLLVEIKQDTANNDVSDATCEVLKKYEGPYLIESFNPIAIKNVRKRLPNVDTGILSQRYFSYPKYRTVKFLILQLLLHDFISKPSFIAYDHRHSNIISLILIRTFFKTPMFTWTVRSQEEEDIAYNNGFDAVIFENYIPKS